MSFPFLDETNTIYLLCSNRIVRPQLGRDGRQDSSSVLSEIESYKFSVSKSSLLTRACNWLTLPRSRRPWWWRSVWPDVEIKSCPNFPKDVLKIAAAVFLIKNDVFQKSPKGSTHFGYFSKIIWFQELSNLVTLVTLYTCWPGTATSIKGFRRRVVLCCEKK